ncbi:MAG: alpha/beta fold hydrolase [Chloroflexi bacterium]|nr:alpha/beta fold hydrolase [Chloroflexota bacterium]
MAWETVEVDADGVRLHVRRLAAAGPPAIYLHGLGVSGMAWQSFARRLVPAWSAIAPDLRGHGESEKPAAGYEPADYARDVAALLIRLDIERAPVIGHSLGALVAFALARDFHDTVEALVLLDPPLDRQKPDVEQVYRLRHALPGELERYLATPALAPLFRKAADGAFEALLRAPRGAPWAWAAASAITAPVLVVQADPAKDGVLGDEAARRFVARLPQGELLSIPGASHAVFASHPAHVAAAVLKFLTKDD